jgi:GGDEF domain-containing protein
VLILLPETELAGAKAVAGRLLARISAGGPRLPLSIGVSAGRAGGVGLERLREDAAERAAEAHERGGSQVAAAHTAKPGAES